MNRLPSAVAVAIGIVVVAMVALVAWGNSGSVLGLDPDSFAASAYLGAWLLVIASGFLAARTRWRGALPAAVFWLALGVALAAGYSFRAEIRDTLTHAIGWPAAPVGDPSGPSLGV